MEPQAGYSVRLLARLATVVLVWLILDYFSDVFIPIAFGGLIASSLVPAMRALRRRGFTSGWAIVVVMFMASAVVTSILLMLNLSSGGLAADLARIRTDANSALTGWEQWVGQYLSAHPQLASSWSKGLEDALAALGNWLTGAVGSTTSALGTLLLIPLYTILVLVYRKRLVAGVRQMVRPSLAPRVPALVNDIRAVLGQYLLGVLVVMLIVFGLGAVGLAIMGVPHAIFLALLAAILNLVPYLGIAVVASLAATLGSWSTGSPLTAVGVVILFACIHLLEANLITPLIVGKRVQLNVLAVVLAVVLGATLWGLPGMILAIPYAAAVRVLAEVTPGWQGLALWLCDTPLSANPHYQPLPPPLIAPVASPAAAVTAPETP